MRPTQSEDVESSGETRKGLSKNTLEHCTKEKSPRTPNKTSLKNTFSMKRHLLLQSQHLQRDALSSANNN